MSVKQLAQHVNNGHEEDLEMARAPNDRKNYDQEPQRARKSAY